MRTCVWVLASGQPCGRPTRYVMVDDGGEPGAAKVRQYDVLCPEHRAMDDAADE